MPRAGPRRRARGRASGVHRRGRSSGEADGTLV